MVMRPFYVILTFLLFLASHRLMAQTPAGSDQPRKLEASRTMQIKRMQVPDKSVDHVTVDGKKYRWFATRQEAITFFNNMTLKYDMIVVYIDSPEADPIDPDLVIIKEPSTRVTE